MNRENAATWYTVFSLLQRALLIDAPNHPALLAVCGANKKIREIKFGKYARIKSVQSCLLMQSALLRQYIGAGIPIFRF